MDPKWRLLDTGYRSSDENYILGKVLLFARSQGMIPDTFRLFQLASPCVLTGYYQIAEQEIRLDYCRQQGIETHRRITGGSALYWDESTIGWEVIVSRNSPVIAEPLAEVTAKLRKACERGLAKLGIAANCKPSGVIEASGCQMGWAGGAEWGGVVLFQGYLRLNNPNVDRMLRALRLPTEKLKNKAVASIKKSVTCVKRVTGDAFGENEVKAALTKGFTEILGVNLVEAGITAAEEYLIAKHPANFFMEKAAAVTDGKQEADQRRVLQGAYKEDSVIRVVVCTDERLEKLQTVSFSGDFWAYPYQVIRQLEIRLQGVAADPAVIHATVQDCFREHDAYLPGLTPESFSQAVMQALAKIKLTKWGIHPEEVNDLCIVGNQSNEEFAITSQGPIPLLLPYCAKEISCKFRYIQGCGRCGQCDIGKVYQLADEYGLQPITIQNYEMLEDQLADLKKKGCRVFIGVCCEAFWVKHRCDFDRIDLPGILINVDNSTCYDLGKEQTAYQGDFENQTRLNYELIHRVLCSFPGTRNAVACE